MILVHIHIAQVSPSSRRSALHRHAIEEQQIDHSHGQTVHSSDPEPPGRYFTTHPGREFVLKWIALPCGAALFVVPAAPQHDELIRAGKRVSEQFNIKRGHLANIVLVQRTDQLGSLAGMSKRTSKGKARARRNKANHGRKPNYGRN